MLSSRCYSDSWKLAKKRHDATNATLRDQQASILSIHTQVGKLTKLVQEKLLDLPSRKFESIPIAQVMAIDTEEKDESVHLKDLEEESNQPLEVKKKEEEEYREHAKSS